MHLACTSCMQIKTTSGTDSPCHALHLHPCQDHDGSHIKGLIMNFLHTFYPSLLRIPGFLVEFITPIIRVSVTAIRLQ